jgi:NADH dehydrogenase [ubiquinone] 1 alpha subcomplex assembly factor 6
LYLLDKKSEANLYRWQLFATVIWCRMLELCGQICRDHDYDRFIVSLLAPEEKRSALWAIFAFHYEIARTKEIVSEPLLGQIRLQWWRDTLAQALRNQESLNMHEILEPLIFNIQKYKIPLRHIHEMIDAREKDLQPASLLSEAELSQYAEDINLPLLKIVRSILGEEVSDQDLAVLARAYGLTGLIRAHVAHTAHGKMVNDSAVIFEMAQKELKSLGRLPAVMNGFKNLTKIYQSHLAKNKKTPPRFVLWRLILSTKRVKA